MMKAYEWMLDHTDWQVKQWVACVAVDAYYTLARNGMYLASFCLATGKQ